MPRLPKSFFTIAGVVVFFTLGFGLFCSTGHDDSHITYWVAHALQKFGQLVNYNGERVEQSSSLAHVLILAALGAVTRIQLPTLGPLTSIVAGAAAVLLVAKLARLAAPNAPRGAPLLVATAESFLHWSFGGLETTIVAAAAVWLVYECAIYLATPDRRRLARAGAAMLLYVTSRPESPLVLACTLAAALAYVVHRRRRWGEPAAPLVAALRPALGLVAVAAVECALLLAFRRAYFGLFQPNPVYSKVAQLAILDGLEYVGTSLFPAALWVLPGVFFGVRHVLRAAAREREPAFAAVLSAAFVVAYLSFMVLVGGDWMRAGRFVAHAFPLLAVVTMIGISSLIRSPRWASITVAILVVMNLAGTLLLAFQTSNGRPIWTTRGLRAQVDARVGDRGFSWFELTNVVHLRDTTVTGEMLDLVRAIRQKAPDRKVVIMSTQAGMVTYHVARENYGAIRFVDTCSLATRYFLTCEAARALLDPKRFGMVLSYESYFGNEAKIDASCGTTRPDILLMVMPKRDLSFVRENGYTIYYDQRGLVRGEVTDGDRSADAFKADQVIAVDTKLLKEIGLTKKARYTWDIR